MLWFILLLGGKSSWKDISAHVGVEDNEEVDILTKLLKDYINIPVVNSEDVGLVKVAVGAIILSCNVCSGHQRAHFECISVR